MRRDPTTEDPSPTTPGSPREPGTASADAQPIPHPEGIVELDEGLYRFRFARTERDLEQVQRLRFEVFNRELGEGFASSWDTGLDEDRFDRVCHHLMLLEKASGALVGTYRMQVASMAGTERDFYCAQEFDLSSLPERFVQQSVELGRACIVKEHRNGLGLFTLWRGLASYMTWSGKRYLFGCCSLTSQDPRDGEAVLQRLRREGRVSEDLFVSPLPGFACPYEGDEELPVTPIPRLFSTYLRYGALACGPPAIDRDFGTIDYFIVIDAQAIDPRLRAMFFAGLEGSPPLVGGVQG